MKGKKAKDIEPKALTHKQRLFADGYLISGKANKAAEEAGHAPGRASEIAANRYMKNPNVVAYIDSKAQKIYDKMEITQEKVLLQYGRLAFFDPRNFYKPDGTLKKVTELDDDTVSALAGMEVETTKAKNDGTSVTTVKIKMPDRRAALDSICKVMGWSSLGKKDPPPGGGALPAVNLDLSQLTVEELRVISIVKRKLNVERL